MSKMTTTINTAKSIVKKIVMNQIESARKGERKGHSPVYLHSSPGIGKSAVTDQVTSELGIGFIDLRLGSMEASDVCGIPYVSHQGENTETMKFSTPEWFPTQEKIEAGLVSKEGVIFFDELSNANLAVQHAAYRLIHDREISNGQKIPEGWQIIAAGNLREDKTGAKAVAPALANRFGTHITIRPDLDDFRAYAASRGLSDEIIGFLSFSAESLYQFDPARNDVAFATPRSWEQVDRLLGMGFSEQELPLVLSGCVGEGTAAKFMAFRKYYEKLPNFIDVMDGKAEYKVPLDDMGMTFAVTSSLISLLIQNHENKDRMKNLEKVLKQLPDDFIVLVYKTIKGAATDAEIRSIVITTRETYTKITPYIV